LQRCSVIVLGEHPFQDIEAVDIDLAALTPNYSRAPGWTPTPSPSYVAAMERAIERGEKFTSPL
jgi:hypothetical protein